MKRFQVMHRDIEGRMLDIYDTSEVGLHEDIEHIQVGESLVVARLPDWEDDK